MESSKMRTLLSLLGVAAVRAFGSLPKVIGEFRGQQENRGGNKFCDNPATLQKLYKTCTKIFTGGGYSDLDPDRSPYTTFTPSRNNPETSTSPSRWCGSIRNQTKCGDAEFGFETGDFRGMRRRNDYRIDLCYWDTVRDKCVLAGLAFDCHPKCFEGEGAIGGRGTWPSPPPRKPPPPKPPPPSPSPPPPVWPSLDGRRELEGEVSGPPLVASTCSGCPTYGGALPDEVCTFEPYKSTEIYGYDVGDLNVGNTDPTTKVIDCEVYYRSRGQSWDRCVQKQHITATTLTCQQKWYDKNQNVTCECEVKDRVVLNTNPGACIDVKPTCYAT